MNRPLKDAELIRKYSSQMGGVFSIKDLCNLFGEAKNDLLHRRIKSLEEGGILTRFCRGFYFVAGMKPEILASRIIEGSYLSLGTILAKEMMIGAIPARTVYAVRIGKNRIFRGPGLTIEYVGLNEYLFFGYQAKNGIRYATAEKALLDTLYFHLRGRSYSFDIYQDVDITRIDSTVIELWLMKYRNKRFVSFVKGYLDDRLR